MIRFSCPVCRVVLSVDDKRAGRKAPCPKCGQRLQVPFPIRNKTILGKPVVASGVADVPGPETSATPVGVVYNDPPRRKWLAPVVVAFLLVLGGMGAATLGLALLSPRPLAVGGSSRDKPAAGGADADKQQFAQFVRENAQDPSGLEIVSWGKKTGRSRHMCASAAN